MRTHAAMALGAALLGTLLVPSADAQQLASTALRRDAAPGRASASARHIEVSTAVTDVLGPHAFTVAETDRHGAPLVVLVPNPVVVPAEGEQVEVEGPVRRLTPSELRARYPWARDSELDGDGRVPVVIARSVRLEDTVELVVEAPPPQR
jgi:hypothetical protein